MRIGSGLINMVMARAAAMVVVAAGVSGVFADGPADGKGGEFAGSFEAGTVKLELTATADGYTGTLFSGAAKFPVTASVIDHQLEGTYSAGTNIFAFVATLDGKTLNVLSGGKRYALVKAEGAAQAGGAGAGGVAVRGKDDPLAKYDVVNVTGAGEMLRFHVAGAKTEHDGLVAALKDLGTSFKDKLDVKGYSNKADHFDLATFTTTTAKPAMKGLAICRLDKDGANLLVMFVRADATAAEVSLLVNGLPMKEYVFPDGTGSVSVPEGWKCNSQGYVGGVQVFGPAGQVVRFYDHVNVYTPDSVIATSERRMGKQTVLVAPFSGPADSIKNLAEEVAVFHSRMGLPVYELQKIVSATDPEAGIYPNGKYSIVESEYLQKTKDGDKLFRSRSRVETHQYDQTIWERVLGVTLWAPDATFDADLPTMLAIARSLKVNQARVGQIAAAGAEARLAPARATVKATLEVQAAREDYFKAQERNSTIRLRSDEDVDEIIRGERAVLDTHTGTMQKVDLFNSHEITAALNEHDPGRFVEIPQRDLVYPLTPAP